MDTQTNLPGKLATEKIEKVLRKADFTDEQIANTLVDIDRAVQEEIGQELINALPPEKKQAFLNGLKENKLLKDLAPLLSSISHDEANKKLEEKLNKIADELENWFLELEKVQGEVSQKLAQYLLEKYSSSPQA